LKEHLGNWYNVPCFWYHTKAITAELIELRNESRKNPKFTLRKGQVHFFAEKQNTQQIKVSEEEYAKGVGSQRKTLGKYAHNAGEGVYYTTTIHSEFSLLKSQLIRRGYVLSRTYWISGIKHEDYDNKKGACPTSNISILPIGPKTKYTVYTVGYSSESL